MVIINKREKPEVIDIKTTIKNKRLSDVRILVVDDSEIIREVAQNILEEDGAIVNLAEDGQVAVEWLTAQADSVDIILMDIQMPRMDGYTATRLIRQNPRWASLPIVALTAGTFDSINEAVLTAGMNDFVLKPFNPEQLLSVIQGCTSRLPIATPLKMSRSDSLETLLPELPGIDVQKGLEHWNQEADYRKILTKYVNSYKNIGNEIAQCLRLNDIDHASMLIHKLKGITGYLALPIVEQCLCHLVELFHEGVPTIDAAQSLQKALDEVGISLAKWETANPNVDEPGLLLNHEAFNPDELRLMLEQLLTALDQDDPDRAEPYLGQLKGCIADIEFNLIREHLSEFAFRKAEEVTRKLIQQLKLQ